MMRAITGVILIAFLIIGMMPASADALCITDLDCEIDEICDAGVCVAFEDFEELLPEELLLPLPEEPLLMFPGTLEGTGTYFELNDSDYLNISVASSEPISIRLESVPEMVTMHIQSNSSAASISLTLGGFAPNTTYYKHEDDYHNLVPFTTDAAGIYTYVQDLSEEHFVFIQPRTSTIFIDETGAGCVASIGTWDPVTKTCTLTNDLSQTVQIDSDDITLDCDGHSTTGTGTGYGTYSKGYDNLTIENCTVMNYWIGIFSHFSSNYTLTNNTVSSNSRYGIYLREFSYGNLTNNIANNNNGNGIHLILSNNNTVTNNIANNNNNGDGIFLAKGNNNTLTGNNVSGNSLRGVYISRSSNNILTGNNASGNTQIGIYLYFSSNNTLTGNNASGNNIRYFGIELLSSSNNIIYNNTANNNGYGIYLYFSSDNNLTNNTVNNNRYGIYLSIRSSSNSLDSNEVLNNSQEGVYLYQADYNTLDHNRACLNGVYDLRDVSVGNDFIRNTCERTPAGEKYKCHFNWSNNLLIDEDVKMCPGTYNRVDPEGDGVLRIEAKDITLDCDRGTLIGGGGGVGIFNPGFGPVTIKNCNLTNFENGIGLQNAGHNIIVNNNASGNVNGIFLNNSDRSFVESNIAHNNVENGVFLLSSENSKVKGNNARYNSNGIHLRYSHGSDVTDGNIASSNTNDGIKLYVTNKSSIRSNTAKDNWIGIHVTSSEGFRIRNNDFRTNPGGNIVIDPSTNFEIIENEIYDSEFGIKLIEATNALISKNLIVNNENGIYLDSSTNISIFEDNISSTIYDLYLKGSFATVLNTTFDKEKVKLVGISGLYVKWFLDVRVVNETGIPMETATVIGYNVSDVQFFNETTDEFGVIPTHTLIEYIQTATEKIYHSPYTIVVSKPDYVTDTREVNLTESMEVVTVLEEVPVIPAIINIDPDTLSLKSQGKWITCYIGVPGYDVSQIDVSTVKLNDIVPAENDTKYGFVKNPEIKDGDGDGYPEFMVKFSRDAVKNIVAPGYVTLEVTGKIDGLTFIGSDIIRVIEA